MTAEYRLDLVEYLDERLAHFPEVESRKIFGHPGYSLQNRVFVFVYADGLCVKLPRGLYEQILERNDVQAFMPGKDTRPMGTWAVISRPDAQEYDADWELIETAMAYVMTEQGAPPKRKPARKRK
ncbi:MAG: hypothetical protein K9N34_03960 [Candidatus Marinimicrobia bacterium]|nr:hypothetical protein [Candidatus Neomarinimicrobiota bacterium]MCF7839803.1 hypothetical protein [Candidatus Neomarinimicrobiota bacterium]MCF7901837.1 hypothetical protein [Candidatus Neomarinimicrobiota bacterium]